MLLFVALFVWIGASQEASATEMKSALSGTPIRAAMVTDFRELAPADTLADAVRLVLQGSQQDFPVVEGRRVVGILTRADLLAALAEHGAAQPVAGVMRRDFHLTDYTEMLETAFQRLQECECHTMPVVHDGRLVGLLTMENLGEYFLIQAAMKRSDARPGLAGSLARRDVAAEKLTRF